MNDIELTIFTPAFNRGNTLERAYISLKNQTMKNFEWLIIDDGSTDETESIVKNLISKDEIVIRYIKQENSGKQAAWNKAIQLSRGNFFCCLDSDDAIYSNTSIEEVFKNDIQILNNPSVIGLRYLAYSNIKKTFDGKKIADDIVIMSWFEDFSNGKNFGERIDVFKKDILKKYLFPVDGGIKFIPEFWFYVNVSADGYKFAYMPNVLRLFYDDSTDNRLSRSSIEKHAKGHYITRSAMLKCIPLRFLLKNKIAYLKTLIRFIQCSNYLKVSYVKRKQDSNIFYAVLSMIIFFITLG